MVASVVAVVLVAPGIANAAKSSSGSSLTGYAKHGYVTSGAAGGGGSGVDQYGEHTPTSSGNKGVGSGKANMPKLSKKALKALASVKGTNGKLLKRILALSGPEAPNGRASAGDIRAAKTKSSLGRSLRAAIVSSGAGSTTRLALLLAAMVAISAAVGVSAVRKQRA
jgi:hypothetical protein